MPVVTITASPHPAERELLSGVADAVAGALGLGEGDVIALAVATRAMVASGQGDADWMLVSIHGSDRGDDAASAAREAAGAATADWNRRHGVERGVWCEWVLPQQR